MLSLNLINIRPTNREVLNPVSASKASDISKKTSDREAAAIILISAFSRLHPVRKLMSPEKIITPTNAIGSSLEWLFFIVTMPN